MTLCVSTRQYERKELLLAMHCGLYKSKLINTSLLPFERKNAFLPTLTMTFSHRENTNLAVEPKYYQYINRLIMVFSFKEE